MAGIYIHIPFCRQACYYCNFHFSTSLKVKDEMLDCLKKEIEIHSQPLNEQPNGMILPSGDIVETLYFGGGTPSILSVDEISDFIMKVGKIYRLTEDAEITLEANPDDITPDKAKHWKDIGINRLSIGIQSFIQRDLKWMNRAHGAEQALDAVSHIKRAGFENFSIDLIFGIPGLTDEEWNQNIDKVMAAEAPHIACYALTVEPKTALDLMIKSGKKSDINPGDQARQFEILMQRMRKAGYEHYEVSNFALPGFRSRHNSSYWQQKTYLGIGPSAHSFDGQNRYWNIANNPLYIKAVNQNRPFFEKEELTPSQKFNEYIMTSLRTIEGVDLGCIQELFGNEKLETTVLKIKNVNREWFSVNDSKVTLTDKGILFTDSISVMLFD